MADIRIKDLATTASTTASDDFLAVDGTTNGTRKLSAATPSFATSVTVPGVAGPTATDLTLAGGSTGASLVLGQGTNGNASVAPAGTGSLIVTKNSTGNNVPGIILKNGAAGYTELDLYSGVSDTVKLLLQASDVNSLAAVSVATNHPLLFGVNASEKMRIATTGNLLIGTTTDGGQKLQVNGTASFAGAVTATGLTLNLSSGFGSTILAGITGYNNFTLNGSNSLTTGMGMYGGASGDSALYINAPATGNVYFRIGGSDKVAIKSSGNLLVGGNTDIAGSGGLKVFGTTPSTGADSGALQVAGGIYSGAASVFGSAVTAGGVINGNFGGSSQSSIATPSFFVGHANGTTASVLQSGNSARGMEIQAFSDGSNNGYWSIGYRTSTPAFFEHLRLYGGATPSAAIATFAGAVSVNSVTPSTGAGSGALQVAGGIYAGALSNLKSITIGYDTSQYAVPGTLSNYSATNGVYLNGNTAGFLIVSGDGSQYSSLRLDGGATGTVTLKTANTTRLTVDGTTGAATFAGAVTVAMTNPEVSIRSSSDTAGQNQFLTFGSANYNRAQFKSVSAGTNDGSLELRTFNAGVQSLSQTWNKDGSSTFSGVVVKKNYTVATLPAAASFTYGEAYVSDATQAAGTSLGSAPTGGGSVKRGVYSDGTSWLLR